MNGTTIRHIADRAGISESVIYRHFESKDQLFLEAVVDPLRAAVDRLIEATELAGRQGPTGAERQRQKLEALYRQLTSTFIEVLPLLGLVLFGDPKVARRFYREHFSVAMDRLAAAWRDVQDRYDLELERTEISARAVMGIALVLALESHHTDGFDLDGALAVASRATMTGFFPPFEVSRRRP